MDDIKYKIMQYGYYDDQHNYNVVLNVDYLKKLFEADNILLEEQGHK